MASKNINIALFLTINLVFFGFTMAQPQPPTCPRSSSTEIDECVSKLNSPINIVFLADQCCLLVGGLDASVASVCLCDAVKRAGNVGQPTNDLFRSLLDICAIRAPVGFRCA